MWPNGEQGPPPFDRAVTLALSGGHTCTREGVLGRLVAIGGVFSPCSYSRNRPVIVDGIQVAQIAASVGAAGANIVDCFWRVEPLTAKAAQTGEKRLRAQEGHDPFSYPLAFSVAHYGIVGVIAMFGKRNFAIAV